MLEDGGSGAEEARATTTEQRVDAHPEVTALGAGAQRSWLTTTAIADVVAAEQRPFPAEEYERRLSAVRARMAEAGLAAMIVFRPSSVEYLCGYHTAETAPQPLLVTETDTYLYVPDLELGRSLASSRVGNLLYCGYADALRSLDVFFDHAIGELPKAARVGIELDHTSTPPRALELLREKGIEVVAGEHLVERVRLVLSAAEIDCMERAAEHTEAGVRAGFAAASEPGATDSSVAAAIAAALYREANSPSVWGPVVATGQRGGIPHSSWQHGPLGQGLTFVEFAGTHHRYHAPVMRTFTRAALDAPDRRLVEMSKAALTGVLETAKAGISAAEVARAGRAAIGVIPDDVVFHQLFGYPVGLAHKPHWMDGAPFYLTVDNEQPLEAGMAFHVPASFRIFGRSVVGLSHTFLVTESGTRVLTKGDAELVELP
ncbi:Xaa-Pro dipeptidase [Tamaricihabitans halophyticus]|uniref:Xaa-Pro dipeptidase n=1 Tax=Tamaricihabitans halophyticus TaxID=1262583 RepID=A0A4R2QMD4_9PSEU|nr:Xaa-Pro peptidase family protein [Tamaricihabitans halophyticus]TCP50039.1 Xaa-Pro dipeptidase [Tamaricihabitans halophyticus]